MTFFIIAKIPFTDAERLIALPEVKINRICARAVRQPLGVVEPDTDADEHPCKNTALNIEGHYKINK